MQQSLHKQDTLDRRYFGCVNFPVNWTPDKRKRRVSALPPNVLGDNPKIEPYMGYWEPGDGEPRLEFR